MKKVLLVDDEIYSLKGMEVFIPWDEIGCVICGSTTDSNEAIEIAIKEKPDIVITDINMPCIDGLELLNILKGKLPRLQGIVITGYDDFKYAVKAIKLNVIDFILKPLDEEELICAVNKAINKLEIFNNVVKPDRKLLDIVRGETNLADIYNYFTSDCVVMAFIDINKRDDKKIQNLIDNIYKELKINNKYYILKPHNYRIVLVIDGEVKDVEHLFKDICKKELSIAVTKAHKLNNIIKCYAEGKKLIEETFYLGYGNIVSKNQERINMSEKDIRNNLDKVYIALNGESNLLIRNSIEDLFKFLKDNRINKEICTSITLDILFKLRGSIDILKNKENNIEIKEIGLTIDYLKSIVILESERYIEIKKESCWIREDRSIDRCIEIIENNYMENLKLKDVAKELYLNESYFSRRFKSTVGVGFNEYLTKVRMEKAIEFLKKGKKIKEVSREVGYIDYRNFSINFKKYTGFNPREYKRKLS